MTKNCTNRRQFWVDFLTTQNISECELFQYVVDSVEQLLAKYFADRIQVVLYYILGQILNEVADKTVDEWRSSHAINLDLEKDNELRVYFWSDIFVIGYEN